MRILSTTIITLFFVVSIGQSAHAQKRKKSTGKVPKIKVFEDKRAKAGAKRKGPQLFVDVGRSKRQKRAAQALDAAIESLKAVIEFEDPSDASFPESLVRLADLYWEKSEEFFDASQSAEVLEAIYKAEESKDTGQIAKARAKQQSLLAEQTRWRRQAITTYQRIEKNHKNYKNLDRVLYAIGFHLTLMKNLDEGYKYYVRLLRERPNSGLIPDTLLNIGDYFFAKNDFEQALAFYRKVQQFGASRVLGYAIYKAGWCYFNMGDKAKAMNRFLDTIRWTESAKAKNVGSAIELKSEAQFDMVRAYSFIGAPQKALKFFKKIAPDIYLKLTEKLALIYTNDSNYGGANKTLRTLIATVGKNPKVLKYQREIVYNTFKAGDKSGVKKEVLAMTAVMERYDKSLDPGFRNEERKELEYLLRVIGTDYHRESEKTLNKVSQDLALTVYEQYLRWFPGAKDYYTMNYNVAILAYQMKEYARAAKLFEKVLEIKADGPYTTAAAHTLLLSYYKLVDLTVSEEKKIEDTGDKYEPQSIPAQEQRLVQACERYIKIAEPGSEDLAEAKFAAGKIYYDYNHFDKAIPYFGQLYRDHPEFPQTSDSARLLLSIFNVTNDIRNLNKWSDVFAKDQTIMASELGPVIREIQASRDFNKCRQMEFDKEYGKAGDCFMSYFRNFQQSKLGDKSLNNAAVMYGKAKLINKALEASSVLYNERGDSPMAPQALYNIGTIYKTIAVYGEAAYYYELYAKNHPDHKRKLLERALARAATYRRALGEYDQAIADYENYYKNFKENKRAPLVFFEIGLIFESQRKWWQVVSHFSKYLKRFGKTAAPQYIITAHSKMGISYWRLGKRKPAMKNFEKALTLFKDLKKTTEAAGKKLEQDAAVMIAEAVAASKFYEGEVILEQMKRIKLKLPQKKFTKSLVKKVGLIEKATLQMQEVAQFQRPHWEIAAFNRIGQAFQNLSDAIENAPIPRNMPEEAQYMLREEFQKKANDVRAKAIQAYRICLVTAKKKEWFNEFSTNAEKNLAALDLEYKFTREIRPQPTHFRPNSSVPLDRESETVAVKDAPSGYKKLPLSSSDKAYNSALSMERQKNWEGALSEYIKITQNDAKHAPSHARVAAMKIRLGQADYESHANTAIQLDKYSPSANNVLAVAAQLKNDWPRSVGYARKALIGNAENMNAYQNLARAYYMTRKYQMAKLVCEQALEIDPNNAGIHNLKGLIWLKLKDVRAAIRSFVKGVKSDAKLMEGHLNLASTVLNFGDFGRAHKHFKTVTSSESQNNAAVLGLAVAARGLKKFDEAQQGYEKLVEWSPNDANVRYNLCLLHGEYKSEYGKALVHCKEFVALAPPKHEKLKEVKKRIKGLKSTIQMLKEEAAENAANPENSEEAPETPEKAPETPEKESDTSGETSN